MTVLVSATTRMLPSSGGDFVGDLLLAQGWVALRVELRKDLSEAFAAAPLPQSAPQKLLDRLLRQKPGSLRVSCELVRQ